MASRKRDARPDSIRAAPARRRTLPSGRLLGGLLLGGLVLGAAAAWAAIEFVGVSPRLLASYIERRASGHNALIEGTAQRVARWLLWIDRGPLAPRPVFPSWAPPAAVTAPSTAPSTTPTSAADSTRDAAARRDILVTDAAQLRLELAQAQPGDVLTLVPGTYRFDGRSLQAVRAGQPQAPITVRAPHAGAVLLEFNLLEGFLVGAPHWIFENLTIVGVCASDDDCEHAFHVVGNAREVVIRNNEIREFNAHIKVNGADGRFPDGGLVAGNRLYNTRPRRTDNPVTLFDLVAASDWRVEDNLIADFVKDGGDYTSYGAFAKGGGAGNRFLRNVVLCEHRLRGVPGRRIGLSFGGGGTGAAACRDRRCVVEHARGLMRDNLIASCADDGIYVNRSAQSELRHNTLIDTAGINLRFAETSAELVGNLVDGPIRVHAGALARTSDNRSTWLPASYLRLGAVRAHFVDALDLDLRWRGQVPRRTQAEAQPDLCGAPRPAAPAYGAFEDLGRCRAGAAR